MGIINRNFYENDVQIQSYFLKHTWCDKCKKADLGLNDPVEYEKNGKIFISGNCCACGNQVVSEIITKQVDEK